MSNEDASRLVSDAKTETLKDNIVIYLLSMTIAFILVKQTEYINQI